MPARDFTRITIEDLHRLRDIEARERSAFFARGPKCLALQDRVLAVALCQGAALHYVKHRNGVKDFDIWTFYSSPGLAVRFPPRWRVSTDFGDPKFGQTPDSPHFIGRRVDLLGRSLDVDLDADPVETLYQYLQKGETDSAALLSWKAMVLLDPLPLLGTVVWPSSIPVRRRKRSIRFRPSE
ncbi:MAG: hypothetical protein ACLQVD_21155 [Capsulimonadaceae bacterium]